MSAGICYLILPGMSVGHGGCYIAAREGRVVTLRNRVSGQEERLTVSQDWSGEYAYVGFNSLMIAAGPHGLHYLCP